MNISSGIPLLPRPLTPQKQSAAELAQARAIDGTASSVTPAPLANEQSPKNARQAPSTTQRDTLAPEAAEKLRQAVNEREQTRQQNLPTLNRASIEGQRAIGAYQQTLAASKEFDGGVLVGIDTFV